MKKTEPSPKEIFFQAIQLDSQEEQHALLQAACGTDQSLRSHVEELLAAHQKAGAFLGDFDSSIQTSVDETVSELSGTQIGPYKLLEVIGEGGMGTVYMAQQTEPIRRRVAVKVIKTGMDTRQVIARFEVERQTLALMDHPNISKVLDAGSTESGRPYFVMELVKGNPITKFCDKQQMGLKHRLELFQQVCHGVQHAHQKGIIHRDIKPSNVLVAMFDDKPVVKVIDFGVAKATGEQLTEKTMFTRFGQVVGTLDYMSPEQAQFNQLDIDTRSDIYSLGAILCELISGEPPLNKKQLKSQALDETLRMIREEEPTKPSTKLSSSAQLAEIASNRNTSAEKLSSQLRGDLDWVVMRALEKARARRYETANSLGEDIHRYLNDEPVMAYPPTMVYRFRKFARRNKASLTLGIAASLIVVFAVATLLISNRILARKERETADALSTAKLEKNRAHTIHEFVIDQIVNSANPLSKSGSRAISVRQALVEAYPLIGEAFQDEPVLAAHVTMNFAEYLDGVGEFELAGEATIKAIDVLSKEYGDVHPYSLKAKRRLVQIYYELRDFEQALSIAIEVVEGSKAQFGKQHEEYVKSLVVLAETYIQARQADNAEQVLTQIFELCQHNHFPEILANAYNLLGNTRLIQHRLDDAKLNWQLALEQFEELGSTFNIWVAKTNIVKAIYDTGNRTEAIKKSQRLVIQAQEHFGTDHPNSLFAISQLADLTSRSGNYEAALTHYQTLLDRTRSKYGPNNARTATAMSQLGQCLARLGKNQEAVEMQQRALEIHKAQLGEADVLTIDTLGRLASAYSGNGSFEKAAECFQKAIEISRRLAVDQPADANNLIGIAVLCTNRGRMLRRQRKLAEAMESYSQALEVLKRVDSERSSAVRTKSFSGRSNTFALMQRWEEAIEDANQAALNATMESSKCAALVMKANFMAQGLGNVDESIEIVEGVLKQVKESPGLLPASAVENVVRLSGVICNCGNRVRDQSGEFKRAIKYYSTAIRFLDLSESKTAKDYRANTYLNRARALVSMKRLEEACDDVNQAVKTAPTPDRADFMLLWKARILAQSGMANESMRIVEDATRRKSGGSDLYFAARTLALCAKAIHESQRNETTGSPQQFSTSVTHCIALLTKANDVGYFVDQNRIVKFQTEKDFDSIRSAPEFEQFARHIFKLTEEEVSNRGN